MSSLTTAYCGVCCECYNGIPYDKFYFYCLHCVVCICNACHGKHPHDHREYIKRAMDKRLPWSAQIDDGKKCRACDETVVGRVQCNGCDFTVCYSCFNQLRVDFSGHEHKALTFIATPHMEMLAKYEPQCTGCTLGASLAHCDRCLESKVHRNMLILAVVDQLELRHLRRGAILRMPHMFQAIQDRSVLL